MVAYSFKPRFEGLIRGGQKRQTIRADRARHARPGEAVQLYVGMRTKACRKIMPDPTCTWTAPIRLWIPNGFEPAEIVEAGRKKCVTPDFAIADGFGGVEDFTRFWFGSHGPGLFQGMIVAWSLVAEHEEKP